MMERFLLKRKQDTNSNENVGIIGNASTSAASSTSSGDVDVVPVAEPAAAATDTSDTMTTKRVNAQESTCKRRKQYIPNVPKFVETFTWLDKSKNFPFCLYCQKKIMGGSHHLKRHASTPRHVKLISAAKNTTQIKNVIEDIENATKYTLVREAELKLCAYVCENNLALLLLDTLPLLNRSIYSDSEIAGKVDLKRGRATKLIVGVLGPAFQNELVEELKVNHFSIIVDETTDISTKKALVIVVRYWGMKNKVEDRFFDLIELQDCSAESIFEAIKTAFTQKNIPLSNIIGLAADNASTMMGQLTGVQARFKEILPNIYVQGCACHSLHLCASAAAKKLPNNVEQFVRDIYSYFSHSSKRCDELRECQIFANETPHKMLYPSQTRWLSLKAVVDRILEHWNSLILFFQRACLEDNLPNAKAILNALNNPIYKMYLLFLSYVLELTTKVNVELQSETPKLPIFLTRLSALFKTFLKCFIKKSVLDTTTLRDININNPNLYVSLENLYVGAKTDAFLKLKADNLSKEELQSFKLRVLEYYIEMSLQVKKRFDFSDKYLAYASNFTQEVVSSGNVMSVAEFINLFPNIDIDIEAANTEWQLLSETNIGGHDVDFNLFWKKVCETKNVMEEPMFENIMRIVKIVLSLPHSSATAERVFSQLSLIKTSTRNRLSLKTCAAIIQVKDKLKFVGGSVAWKPGRNITKYDDKTLYKISL